MTVADLKLILDTLPEDATVWHLWDGSARTAINHVYLARSGKVITSDYAEYCADKDDFPGDFNGDYYTAPPFTDDLF